MVIKSIEFLVNRMRSFKNAFLGIRDILLTEHNAWIHAVVAILVLSLSVWLKLSLVKMALIIMAITLVWVAESFNTVLELVVNIVSPGYTQIAKRTKDIAAGAVLLAAIGAAIVGLLILSPPLLKKIGL
jgi:diacylglycerol kinase (ATP)